ncbi:porin [Vibrio alfacsensis]|uniref:porin n=1 Tax=Vibrio alfacsensis TaxID=1074311 RepID=UPI004068EF57
MKMKTLAVAVAALACGTQTFAAEIYNSDGTSMAIGGYVDVGLGEYFEENVEIHQVSPRINVVGKHDIGNGVTVDAKGEWSIKFLDGGANSFNTRLGYIGATHAELGRVVAGTQWSPYYDVAGVADMPIAFANDFLYTSDMYQLGTGRAEKMLSYSNAYEFGNGFGFGLGVGWQGQQTNDTTSLEQVDENCTVKCAVYEKTTKTKYDDRGQIALSTELAGFGLGYTYSGGDVKVAGKSESATSHVISANYGEYGSGLYAAIVYGKNKNFFSYEVNGAYPAYDKDVDSESRIFEETTQLDGLLAYGVNDWTFSVNYESVEDDKASKTLYSQSAIQAEYAVTSAFYTFAGYQFDLGNDIGDKENDWWTIGARYYF